MPILKESELILNEHQKVYHLQLNGSEIADDVILVGDPGRVETISNLFSSIEHKNAHREFVSHTGYFNQKRLTVLSTGIGPDNIDIVMNELDAAVNIEPNTRQTRHQIRTLNIYRLGTCGALQEDLPINSVIASSAAIGLDGLLNFYAGADSVLEPLLSEAFLSHFDYPSDLTYPYAVKADETLLKKLKGHTHTGITLTAPGFYAPQGRQLRLKTALPHLHEQVQTFVFQDQRILNFEMETSALYGLGKLLQHRCLTVCVVIANRIRKEFSSNYQESVNQLIEKTLNSITHPL